MPRCERQKLNFLQNAVTIEHKGPNYRAKYWLVREREMSGSERRVSYYLIGYVDLVWFPSTTIYGDAIEDLSTKLNRTELGERENLDSTPFLVCRPLSHWQRYRLESSRPPQAALIRRANPRNLQRAGGADSVEGAEVGRCR